MPAVQVLEVTQRASESAALLGGSVDRPIVGPSDGYAIEVAGWVLVGGEEHAPLEVELTCGGEVLRRVIASIPRDDVARVLDYGREHRPVGFLTAIGVLGLPPSFTVDVAIVLAEGERVRIGSITARHEPVRSGVEPRIQPLLVTALGRTGTTWLMRLLAEHPAIAMHRRYPFELRAAAYWAQLAKVLSEPANLDESSHPDRFMAERRTIGHPPFATPSAPAAARTYLAREYPARLAALCQSSIDEVYGALAAEDGIGRPLYFAEKVAPNHIPRIFWELYEGTREIVLVRDWRDMYCSICAFNERRGNPGFGRSLSDDEESYLAALGLEVDGLVDAVEERGDRLHVVRYEDLVADPVSAVDGILRYAGLDADVAAMVERASESVATLAHHRTTESPDASIGRWEVDLPVELRLAAEAAFARGLAAFGYDRVTLGR